MVITTVVRSAGLTCAAAAAAAGPAVMTGRCRDLQLSSKWRQHARLLIISRRRTHSPRASPVAYRMLPALAVMRAVAKLMRGISEIRHVSRLDFMSVVHERFVGSYFR